MATMRGAARELLRREAACSSLRQFVRQGWPVVEPSTPLVWGWHLDALCDHLQAVSERRLKNLLVMVPPGSGKSTVCSVFWPVWHWLHQPEARFLTASYSLGLALRDSTRSRRVLGSPWYRNLLRPPSDFRLTGDQNAKGRYENDRTGYRVALSVGSAATGERGTFSLIDDAHNVTEAESAATREGTILWHDEAFFNRVNDAEAGGRVVIGQRVGTRDLIGHLYGQPGWVALCLPEEHEAEQHCRTSIGFEDPRTFDGELLRPERFGPDQVEEAKERLGPYAYAAQHQQRPVAREGGIFKEADLARLVPWTAVPRRAERVRYWDKGYSARGDPTAGVLMAKAHGKYYVEDVTRGRWEPRQRNDVIRETANADRDRNDGRNVRQCIEMPPGAGVETTRALASELAGLLVEIVPARRSKEENAEPLASQCSAGNVYLVIAPWNRDFRAELCVFPFGANDDQVDAASGAFLRLCRPASASPAAGGEREPWQATGQAPLPQAGSYNVGGGHYGGGL